MHFQKVTELTINNFGPFVGVTSLTLPTNGLVLLKGKITETGGGSGAGKSFLLNSIPHVLGYCPFPATQLQSWDTEEEPFAQVKLETQNGIYQITRSNGLTIKGGNLKNQLKGKVAETELDSIFGNLDSKSRGLITYRPQKKPGLFFSMDDSKKKEFLTKVLELNKYEEVKDKAEEAIDILAKELEKINVSYSLYQTLFTNAETAFNNTTFNQSNLDDLLSNKNSTLLKVELIKEQVKLLQIQIEESRKEHLSVLDQSLKSVREEILTVTNKKDIPEILELKREKDKQQERLEKCKKYDEEQRIKVIQQRNIVTQQLYSTINNLSQEIIQVNSTASLRTSQETAKLNQELSDSLQVLNKELLEVKQKIEKGNEAKTLIPKLKLNEQRLLKNICPTCEQTWDNAKKELETNRKDQSLLQTLIDGLPTYLSKEKEIENTVSHLKNETTIKINGIKNKIQNEQQERIKALEEEKEGITQSKNVELSEIIDLEPHPAGIQIKNRIDELTQKIDNIQKTFEQEKNNTLTTLFQQEQNYKNSINTEYQSRVNKIEQEVGLKNNDLLNIQKQIADLDSLIQKQLNIKETKERLLKDYQKATLEFNKVKKQKNTIESKFNLESDVVALVGYKGFLGAIFSDVLDEIADRTNDILSHVANVRHLTLTFETEKESLTTKNIQSKIVPIIHSRGRKVSFEVGISGGMQTAVELAVDLGVSNVVSSRRGSYPGFMILDESLHGLSGVEKENCIEMLGNTCGDKLIMVVDHSSEFCNLFNQVITVEQTDGVSRVI